MIPYLSMCIAAQFIMAFRVSSLRALTTQRPVCLRCAHRLRQRRAHAVTLSAVHLAERISHAHLDTRTHQRQAR
eukprot:1742040-Pleurochrysis_carterae.AAC.4